MNQLLSRNGDHLPLGPDVFHARLRAQDAYVEPDQTHDLPAVPDPTDGTTPLFLASASRLAGTRHPPQPAHSIFGDDAGSQTIPPYRTDVVSGQSVSGSVEDG